MKAYLIKRLLHAIPIILGVMLITFLLFNVVGGDPTIEMAGKYADAKQIAQVRHEYGFDRPLIVNIDAMKSHGVLGLFDSQLFRHFKQCATFDFGKSFRERETISTIILNRAGPSLSLTIPMFFISLLTSIAISLFVANVRGTWIDRTLVVLCVIGMSMPYLSYIMFGQWFFAFKLDWFPILGYPNSDDPATSLMDYVRCLTLPVLIGVASGLGGSVRFYRTVMLDEIHSDYVRTARAKGASMPRVLFKHVLKNAMIPIITQVVMAIPFLFLGSLLLERFFSIPGLGYLMIDAVNSRDYPVISAMTFIGAILYVIGLIVTDICYALVDPRVDLQQQ